MADPTPLRTILEYEFYFVSGSGLALTIDPQLGDTVTETDDQFTFDIVPRKLYEGATDESPAEHTVVYRKHVVGIQSRTHLIPEVKTVNWGEFVPDTPEAL